MGLTSHWDAFDHSSHEQTNYDNESDNASSVSIEDGLEDIQCLFCDRTSSNLDQNLSHMSTAHGLHVVTDNLIVDVGSLLSYFHLVVSVYHEYLFCGTQRNTRQAIRQHMIAKGHCKYDLTAKGNEFRDFYDFSSSQAEDELARRSLALRLSDDAQLATQDRTMKSKRAKRSGDHNLGLMAASKNQTSASSSPEPHNDDDDDNDDDDGSDNTEKQPGALYELSTRAQKQTYTLDNQLAQLRADDRRSLMHLPVSQQRALLATHHKQAEKARRSEQTQRGNLESAGNSFARLGTIRLIRQPPHTGRVQTLRR